MWSTNNVLNGKKWIFSFQDEDTEDSELTSSHQHNKFTVVWNNSLWKNLKISWATPTHWANEKKQQHHQSR